MAETVDYFIPPEFSQAGVLAGDLSPLPANACDAFIHAYVPDGGTVWDPFCRTDAVARAAARQGKHALLSDFNPLIAFTVRATLNPVSPRQLDRAFAALEAAPVQQTTLKAHINALYATSCPVCGKPAQARSFVWAGEPAAPRQKVLQCVTCSDVRVVPVNDEDLLLLPRAGEHGRAYWTILERLGATEGALRPLAERLLDLYTARSLYALATIQRELEVLPIDRAVQDVLMLGLLEAMERCIKRYGDEPHRQRASLARPPAVSRAAPARPQSFVESNCWLLFSDACAEQRARLERAASAAAYLRPAPLAGAGDGAGDEARVRVRNAAARRLADTIPEASIDLILASPPALDWGDMLQLTYLWTGWLLGKDEARAFSPQYLMRPRRMSDWAWFYAAMQKSLQAMVGTLAPQGKVILCLPLNGVTYLNVLLLACSAAGLRVENIAYQPASSEGLRRPTAVGSVTGYCYLRLTHGDIAQALSPISTDSLLETARLEAAGAAAGVIRERGEPAAYVWVFLAALLRLSQTGILTRLAALPTEDVAPWDRLRQIETAAMQGSGGSLLFVPWAAPQDEPTADDETTEDDDAQALARQRGWWWLADAAGAPAPLSDRVEWAVYTVLSTTPMTTTQAAGRVVYALFPGLQTPEAGLIEACVRSYAKPVSPVHWQLRPEDALAQRSGEHTELLSLLADLGHRLGFKVWIGRPELGNRQYGGMLNNLLTVAERYMSVEGIIADASEHSQLIDVVWYQNRRASHVFEVEWTAMLGESVLRRGSRAAGMQRFLVMPPERADLVREKAERSPLLRERLAADGWLFMRFDVLRELAQADALTAGDLSLNAGFKRTPVQEGLQLALW